MIMKRYIKDGIVRTARQISVLKTVETVREVIKYEPIEGEEVDGITRRVPKTRAVTKTEKVTSTIRVYNPTEEDILADGWEVYVPEPAEPYDATKGMEYAELVNYYIRERYSESDEFAILRQRDTKLEEYAGYYAYCEECKSKAKKEYEKLAE